ncbi:hypothetical protein BKA64DRAFT_743577 [Cadophora sp. MPI-SDFR-AT-0126]|nr:hypothetical protein BKA64DRAFT_743577 [Leotiomycetes sp. MPI-SDFR-AT-0126]
MTGSRIPIPSKIPQVPKRNLNRPVPSNLQLPKRQADALSLRRDPRTKDVSSIDNDRKRRGRVMFEEDKVQEREEVGEQCDSFDIRYNPNRQFNSAIDLSSDPVGHDQHGNLDVPYEHRSMIPRPLSLKAKSTIDIPTARGKVILKSPPKSVPEDPDSSLPYSDSEYSDDDDAAVKSCEEQRTYNHDVNFETKTRWMEVHSRTLTYTKTSIHQLECKSRVSRSNRPYGRWFVDFKVDVLHEKSTIAFIKGKYIQRSLIKSTFQQVMKTVDDIEIPSDLFDRYGRLKRQFKDHQVIKGTGIWGDELDHEDIFIVDVIHLNEDWADVDLGVKMIKSIIEVAREKGLVPAFVLMDPTFSTRMLQDHSGNQYDQDTDADAYSNIHATNVTNIIRDMGFRRVGISRCFVFATDVLHSSRNLCEEEDRKWDDRIGILGHQFNQFPEMESEEYFGTSINAVSHLSKLANTHPMHWATMTLSEDECLQLYSDIERNFEFVRHDPLYRNVLHIAASEQKPQCVIWLLKHVKKLEYLKVSRNMAGYTPLEELEAKLEKFRTTTPYFDGFPVNAVLCLAALREESRLDAIDRRRIRFGCTCGGCMEGFMSPRTQFALVCKATKTFHKLDRNIYDEDESPWKEQNSDILKYVKPEIQVTLGLSQYLRHGFINIFLHIAEIVESQIIPSTESIKNSAGKQAHNQLHVPGSIFENGTTDAAIQIVFELARDCDEWAGNGEHELEFKEECVKLPRCRNDHEWELVARMCGLKELESISL